MKKIILIAILILMIGCTPITEENQNEKLSFNSTPTNCENNTIIKEVQVIKEIIREVPKVCQKCPEIDMNKTCENKLTFCHIRVDQVNSQLYDCMIHNTSSYSDNMTIEFNKCQARYRELEEKTDEIMELLD